MPNLALDACFASSALSVTFLVSFAVAATMRAARLHGEKFAESYFFLLDLPVPSLSW
jgi:hypothetical protein